MKYPLIRRPGMAPVAFNAFVAASNMAGIDLTEHPKSRQTQTMGTSVAASAGTHARDGYILLPNGQKEAYSAATDLSVLWLSLAQVRAWVEALPWFGHCGFYRPWYTDGTPNFHVHTVFAGLPMKAILRAQIKDYKNGRNGLKGHGRETFYTPSNAQDEYIWALYLWANEGGPKPPASPKLPKPPAPPSLQLGRGYDLFLNGQELPFDGVAIGGKCFVPARPFLAAMGYDKTPQGFERVKWHPETERVYVDNKPLQVPTQLLRLNDGPQSGFLSLRELQPYFSLGISVNGGKIALTRKV